MENITIVFQKYIKKKACPSLSGLLGNIVQCINFVKSIDLRFLDNFPNNQCEVQYHILGKHALTFYHNKNNNDELDC